MQRQIKLLVKQFLWSEQILLSNQLFILSIGLDLEHAKLALRELARFHGLGMAVRKLKPELFAEAKKLMLEFPFEMSDSEMEKFVGQTFSMLSQDPRTAKHLDRIQESLKGLDWKALISAEPVEPWITITHGDFWVNNMMFREGTRI